jgi:DNA modification methylase
MKATVVQLPVGDRPPEGHLYYGTHVLDALRELPPASVHCVVTSPPYWALRDYGSTPTVWGGDPTCEHDWADTSTIRKGSTHGREDLGSTLVSAGGPKTTAPGKSNDHGETKQYRRDEAHECSRCGAWRGSLGLEPTPELYVEHLVEVFREVRRVLRPDGTLWLNLGDSYFAGGSTTGLSQSPRPYEDKSTLATPHSEGSTNRPVKPHTHPHLKPKDAVGIPWRVALALQEDGWWLRNAVVWLKPNPLPNPAADRLWCKYEQVFLLSPSRHYYFDLDGIRIPHTYGEYDDDGMFIPAQRWLTGRSPKMTNTEGQLGTHAGPPKKFAKGQYNPKGKNPGDVWELSPSPYPGAHFAVFPPTLPERCIRAGTSRQGVCPVCGAPWEHAPKETVWTPGCSCGSEDVARPVVLDPFSGSGTTGAVALELGCDYIGIDLQANYLKMAMGRLLGEKGVSAEGESEVEEGSVLDLFGE